MKLVKLGSSDLMVSECCLGTMTWGEQNTEEEAHAQLDAALELGINFIDTAEMYPVPPSGKTFGSTEVILGNWLAKNPGVRKKLILASKVAGPGRMWVPGARRGEETEECPRFDAASIKDACEKSLKRLQTDYLDLFYLHWPDRYCPGFGFHTYDGSRMGQAGNGTKPGEKPVPFEEQVAAMGELIKAGKVKHWALSNETSYGVCMFVEACKKLGVPPPIGIQNDFSLLDRKFETELAETCCEAHHNVGLCAYGCLGGGVLTGKYDGGGAPEKGRHVLHPGFQPRYHSPRSKMAAERYSAIAKKHGMSPSALALSWAIGRFYCASVIIGATTVEQLKECAAAFDAEVPAAALAEIDTVHREIPNPNRSD